MTESQQDEKKKSRKKAAVAKAKAVTKKTATKKTVAKKAPVRKKTPAQTDKQAAPKGPAVIVTRDTNEEPAVLEKPVRVEEPVAPKPPEQKGPAPNGKLQQRLQEMGTMSDRGGSTMSTPPSESTTSSSASFWPKVAMGLVVIVIGFMYIRSVAHDSAGTQADQTAAADSAEIAVASDKPDPAAAMPSASPEAPAPVRSDAVVSTPVTDARPETSDIPAAVPGVAETTPWKLPTPDSSPAQEPAEVPLPDVAQELPIDEPAASDQKTAAELVAVAPVEPAAVLPAETPPTAVPETASALPSSEPPVGETGAPLASYPEAPEPMGPQGGYGYPAERGPVFSPAAIEPPDSAGQTAAYPRMPREGYAGYGYRGSPAGGPSMDYGSGASQESADAIESRRTAILQEYEAMRQAAEAERRYRESMWSRRRSATPYYPGYYGGGYYPRQPYYGHPGAPE